MAWGKKGKPDKKIADYTAVVEMADAPVREKARAFANRAWAFYRAGDVTALVSDSRRALELDATLGFARFNLGLGLLLSGQVGEAAEEYRDAAALCRTSAEVSKEGIADLEAAIAKRLLLVPGHAFSCRDTNFRISYAASDKTLAEGLKIFEALA